MTPQQEPLPDIDTDFVNLDGKSPPNHPTGEELEGFFLTTSLANTDLAAFARAVNAPDASEEDFITALNDWRPVRQRIRRKNPKKRLAKRGKDETREGFGYKILKWPMLGVVFTWISILS